MDITEHIRTRGLKRGAICKAAGISRAYLSLIERGQRRVGPEKVRALAGAMGLSIADLRPDLAEIFDDGAVPPPTDTQGEDAA